MPWEMTKTHKQQIDGEIEKKFIQKDSKQRSKVNGISSTKSGILYSINLKVIHRRVTIVHSNWFSTCPINTV